MLRLEHVCVRWSLSVCVGCVCERERERWSLSLCVCVRERERWSLSVRVWGGAWVRVCVCVRAGVGVAGSSVEDVI